MLPNPTRVRRFNWRIIAILCLLCVIVFGLWRIVLRPPTPEELTTQLWGALVSNDEKGLKQALDRGANPNIAPPGSEPPLLTVVNHYGHMADILLAKGADPNLGPPQHEAPLVRAIAFEKYELAQRLIDGGANVNLNNPQTGNSPLRMAMATGASRKFILYLIAKGADVNFSKPGYSPPLMLAVERNDAELVKAILAKGADPHAKNLIMIKPETDTYAQLSALDLAHRNKRYDIEKILMHAP